MRSGLTVILCAILLGGTSAQAAEPSGIGRAVGQPFRDLSLIRDKAPEILMRAAEAPYDLPVGVDCIQIRLEIADLDVVLGPDIDVLATKKGLSANALAGDLIGGVVKIPFRGIVRRVSGAQSREEAIRAAVLAGMVRRGFLKGRLDQLACPAPEAPVQ
jgi:hypothetical protein